MKRFPFGDPPLSPRITGLIALHQVTHGDRSSIGESTLPQPAGLGKAGLGACGGAPRAQHGTMALASLPSTPATRLLKELAIEHSDHPYRYEEHGGTAVCARALGVAEHAVVKTLILEDEAGKPLVMLMHGDREVSLKALARQLGCRQVHLCQPEVANRHSGYQVGGTSPFGTRKAMPVYVEQSILDLERIYLNGGSRGFLVGLAPAELVRALGAVAVTVAT